MILRTNVNSELDTLPAGTLKFVLAIVTAQIHQLLLCSISWYNVIFRFTCHILAVVGKPPDTFATNGLSATT